MQKLVLKLNWQNEKVEKRVTKIVSGLSGVETSWDRNDKKKLTLTGDIDAVHIVSKLRKLCPTEILSVGPAKEEKKEERNKDDNTDNKKDNKDESELVNLFKNFNPSVTNHYYVRSTEENPNACVIS